MDIPQPLVAMLAGDHGPTKQKAARLVVDLASTAGATEFVTCAHAHVSGVSPLTGGHGLRRFLADLATRQPQDLKNFVSCLPMAKASQKRPKGSAEQVEPNRLTEKTGRTIMFTSQDGPSCRNGSALVVSISLKYSVVLVKLLSGSAKQAAQPLKDSISMRLPTNDVGV